MEKNCWANTDDFEDANYNKLRIPDESHVVSSTDSVYRLKEIAKKGIVGTDIMEVCPSFDVKDYTSHLTSRIISKVLDSSGEM